MNEIQWRNIQLRAAWMLRWQHHFHTEMDQGDYVTPERRAALTEWYEDRLDSARLWLMERCREKLEAAIAAKENAGKIVDFMARRAGAYRANQ